MLIVEEMPDIATDAHAIAFGNFAKGYTVAERPDMRILRDPYTANLPCRARVHKRSPIAG